LVCAAGAAGAETVADRIAAMEPEQEPAVERFRRAYEILIRADEARDSGGVASAIEHYRHALETYIGLSQEYPDWQPGMTRFRISYCNSQLETLLQTMNGKAGETSDGSVAGSPLSPVPMLRSPDVGGGALSGRSPALREIIVEARRLLSAGQIKRAKDILVDALRIDPDDRTVRLLLGVLHCGDAEFENAMYIMEPLVDENQTNAVIRLVMGTAYFGLGRTDAAREQIERALMIDPEFGLAHYDLAQVLMAADPPEVDAARLHYSKALELGESPDEALAKALGVKPEE